MTGDHSPTEMVKVSGCLSLRVSIRDQRGDRHSEPPGRSNAVDVERRRRSELTDPGRKLSRDETCPDEAASRYSLIQNARLTTTLDRRIAGAAQPLRLAALDGAGIQSETSLGTDARDSGWWRDKAILPD